MQRERQSLLRPIEHFTDRRELLLVNKIIGKQIRRKLYSNFPNLLGLTVSLFPYVLQIVPAEQDQIIIADLFYLISDNPPYSGSILDEIQLVFLMIVQRIRKLRFVSFHNKQAIFFRQWRYFCNDMLIHAITI